MRAYYLIALVLAQYAVVAPAARAQVPAAIAKVVTMLENLITMMESEQAEDEKKFNHFNQYCESEKTASTNKIAELNTKIEGTNAALQDLKAQKAELDSVVGKLSGEIDQEQSQVNAATDKRNEEHDAFVKEQQDFANAVAACNKAVKLLGDHYGDAPTEAKKPSWMSLVNTQFTTISKSIDSLSSKGQHKKLATALKSNKGAIALLHRHKGKGPFEQYSDSRDESMNIVDQVKVLAQTFAEDKQSAIEEENRLQKTFDGLIAKKNAILSTLRGERDTQQAVLNQVNQNIAENESALKMAQDTLADTQTYLAAVTKQHEEATQMYQTRTSDRKDETKAVNQALEVLSDFSLIQKAQGVKALDNLKDLGKHNHRKGAPYCSGCAKVAAMLRQKARLYHSAVLSAAAATSMGSDAIDGVISNLKELITRIDEEQKTEGEHKDWCEEETGLTNAKVADHSGIVDEMKGVIADLGEVIKEKDIELTDKVDDIYDEDDSFEALTEIRKEDKEEFEENLQDHMDAIQALNEAIEILANFYAKRKEKAGFVQVRHRKLSFLQRSIEPSGGKVVDMMSGTRHEFEVASKHLSEEEVEAVKTFDDTKKRHMKVDADLHSDKNQITVEEQTAEAQLETAKHDKVTNENEVEAGTNYLKQLGRSCYPLMMHFDERTRLRKEEKGAIKDAIKVLRNA
jgi:ABC-type transporter Mla subunit MlaD